MAAFYGNRIRAGIMTLEEVPKLWRKKTELWLQKYSTGEQRVRKVTEIIQYIISNWTEWLFVGISGFLGYGYKQLLKRQKEEAQKNEALHDGMQALLRDRIIQAYNHYQDKGFCPIYGKENVKRMYDAYHVLGGNDVATQLKDTLIKMPEEPMEREE